MDLDRHLNFRPSSEETLEKGVRVERHVFVEGGNTYSLRERGLHSHSFGNTGYFLNGLSAVPVSVGSVAFIVIACVQWISHLHEYRILGLDCSQISNR